MVGLGRYNCCNVFFKQVSARKCALVSDDATTNHLAMGALGRFRPWDLSRYPTNRNIEDSKRLWMYCQLCASRMPWGVRAPLQLFALETKMDTHM